jgi:hypothetical protein
MQPRQHRRVRLRLPVRFRWTAPFGQQTEICESVDASRGGLLVRSEFSHAAGASLWVTFPYDASLRDGQPEIPARVIRSYKPGEMSSETRRAAADQSFFVAICFAPNVHAVHNGNGHEGVAERRSSARHPLSVPVRIRPEQMIWFEETMTMDVSSEGLRFVSNREYARADRLLISFDAYSSAPWPSGRELLAQIVRIDTLPDKKALAFIVQRVP